MSATQPLIQRFFTKELEDSDKTVFDLFEWKTVDVLLQDYKTGRVLTDLKNLEFPVSYSQQACDIIASKYFRKAGVPTPEGHETSMRQVTDRMASFWVASLKDEGLIDDEEGAILYDEIVYGLLAQMFAPNSPQWFNTGLKLKYGITGGKSDLFYYDPEKDEVVKSEDDYTRTQASACFILSIRDQLLGPHSISEAYVSETKLFKGGSGTGTNFSSIRAEGEALSGGGQSSGLMSFLKGLDRNAGAIKSGGTTRRAAKMVCLDIDHPEIEAFISWKAREEDKVMALAKMGYDGDIDGEAYQTVSGQNSNNSVRFGDDFMKAVDALDRKPDAMFRLRGRIDDRVDRDVSVKSLWDLFNRSAWRCADPAPQFDDTFNAWHTCPAGEDGEYGAKHNRINSTNPCGEYAFLDDTSCNLASINILRFLRPDGTFDVAAYLHMITVAQLVLESSIHWGQFPTPAIARKTWGFRATGLGMANLASLLMVLGLPYDSDDARNLAGALTGVLTGQSYAVSARLAECLGPFEHFEINRPYMMRVIRNHSRAAGVRTDMPEDIHYELPIVSHEMLDRLGFADLAQALTDCWKQAEAQGEQYGYRNAQVTVMAPTGTISFAMDCAATSIEPFFSHVTYKKLSGGGYMKLVNPMVMKGLAALGYSEAECRAIDDYIMREDEDGMILDGKIEGAPYLKDEHLPIFDTANQCGTGERFISHVGHVKMVAAITPLVSGAISKTVNLPREATVEDFADVVLSSWKLGIKGITLYRDGSKYAQPLNLRLGDGEAESRPLEDLSYHELLRYARDKKRALDECNHKLATGQLLHARVKPVGIRSGVTHPAQIEDVKVYITVNRDADGDITELFMTTDREGTLITGLLNSLSKTISVMLQYGIKPKSISKMLRGQKFEPYGFVQRHPYIKYCTSVSDLISKVLDIESGDYTCVQVKPSRDDKAGEADEHRPSQVSMEDYIHSESARDALKKGERIYDGSTCSNCSGTRMVRNGTCKVCLDCGETTGCS